jgi:signal transduction histidine kinase
LLRDDGQSAERAPTPDLSGIDDLVSSLDAPVQVSLKVDGPLATVPSTVGTAAYRIVQESLTNVVRHAAATHAQVAVLVAPDRGLTVEVTDDGTGGTATSNGRGLGLQGMRERAESTGGRLEAGPRPGGGFLVRATWEARG